MAITNTREVKNINVEIQGDDKLINVAYEYNFDDTEDDQLPISTIKTMTLRKYELSHDGNDYVETLTDITSHDQLVQTICNAVWSEEETPKESEV